jgi:hypothetical protein
LLVFFTISCVPKSFFHDLIANHQDVISCEHPGKAASCVHPKGFNCSFEKLVVTSPYVVAAAGFSIVKPVSFPTHKRVHSSFVLSPYFPHSESRGPPSIV